MESLDPVLLSRIQFAFTAAFHYIFPPLSIGLGVLLVIMQGMYLRTGNPIYEAMTKFWVKVFALTFAMGVASGIVLEFQFGTNWATYSRFVGDVFGSALAAEGIFAFFLESGFLAVMVFGWDKVSKGMHFFSTIMVALGSMFSAVWIVVANSWQQTPAGFRLVGRDPGNPSVEYPVPTEYVHDPAMVEGLFIRAEITDFWEMVFNPSSMIRLAHVLVGCYIVGAFVVMSICSWYILKGKHLDFARRCFVLALFMGTLASLTQAYLGSRSAEIVAEHQPAKLAAMEGLFETRTNAPIYLFGWPSTEDNEVKWGLAVPGMLSFLAHWDFNAEVTGLDAFEPRDRPPVWITFQSYHLMVGLGVFFILLTLFACFKLWRGSLFETRWLMWVFVFSAPLPFLANHLGWITAEVGRQPWVVYGLLRTEIAASKSVEGWEVAVSLVMFLLIYSLLFTLFVYVLDRKIKEGPHLDHIEPRSDGEVEDLLEAISRRGKSQYTMTGGEE
jgi:cytochrome bd ubiquinol oxidase subunit I